MVFPDKPLTAKPLETRMVKVKVQLINGLNIKPGRICFETVGVSGRIS